MAWRGAVCGVLVLAGTLGADSKEARWGLEAMEQQEWQHAIKHLSVAVQETHEDELLYSLATCYFQVGELERANEQLTAYLARRDAHKIVEALELKFAIAEGYRLGGKRRLFNVQRAPKILGGGEDALVLYDEVMAAIPQSDLAGRAAYSKGLLFAQTGEMDEAIKAYERFIDEYPRHALGSDGFLALLHLYLDQARLEPSSQEWLERGRSVCRQWSKAYPNDPRREEGQTLLVQMEDEVSYQLLDRARFYERVGKKPAAQIYYKQLIQQFPETAAAHWSELQLPRLDAEMAKAEAWKIAKKHQAAAYRAAWSGKRATAKVVNDKADGGETASVQAASDETASVTVVSDEITSDRAAL
jgi:tetratricopeptide (TPR) repeat protein